MPGPPEDPAETVAITVLVTDHGYETHIGGSRCTLGPDLRKHDTGIASSLNRLLLDHEPDLLHLHAGAVACGDDGVVLLGSSGSGKSTLTAYLVRSGWTYLTDEMLALEPDPLRLRPYPRPLTLKKGSWALFPEIPEVKAAAEVADARPLTRLELPPSELGATVADSQVAIALLVSVQWVDAEPSVTPPLTDRGVASADVRHPRSRPRRDRGHAHACGTR